MTACSFNINCCRVNTEVLLHVSKALFEDSTAASISVLVVRGTLVTNSLVAGSCRLTHSVALESRNCPSMNSFVVGATLEYDLLAREKSGDA